MRRIACVGDIHLINPDDPRQDLVEQRSFFIAGQESLRQLFRRLEQSDVDHVIFLGDIVDWASDANMRYAADFLQQLQLPWSAVPGNHDYQNPERGTGQLHGRDLRQRWLDYDIDFSTRCIDAGDFSVHLLDNALSFVEEADLETFANNLHQRPFNVVCQHVPLDLPPIRAAINAQAPGRDFNKYVCSPQPDLFHDYYQGQVQAVVSGHVHMHDIVHTQGETVQPCAHYLCNVGIDLHDSNRNESCVASACMLTFSGERFEHSMLDLV